MVKIKGKTKVGEKFQTIPSAGEDMEKADHPHTASGNVKLHSQSGNTLAVS